MSIQGDRLLLAAAGLAALLHGARPLLAEPAPSLGVAASFAVLGESAVTNSSATTVTGNLGVSAGSVSGAPVVELGRIYTNDALTRQAQADSAAAYSALAARPCEHGLTGQDLGGQILTEGIYCFSSSAALTGTLVLDARGSADAVWVFRVPGTLTTGRGSSVLVAGGGFDGHVFWQVAGSATLGEESAFIGNILALNGIAFGHGARLSGRALTQTGAVTLNGNRVSLCCSPLVIVPSTIADGMVGTEYRQVLAASGGIAPYVFTVSSGTLPAGLTLTGGTIHGIPENAGTSRFTVTARDARGCESSALYSIPVGCGTTVIELPPLPATATVDRPYGSFRIEARGGTEPYTYTISPNPVRGFTFLGNLLSGAPETLDDVTFTITATDVNGCIGSRTYTIDVICPEIRIFYPDTLEDGTVGVPYALPTFEPIGGKAPYVFTQFPESILTTTPGPQVVTVTATDANGCIGSRTYRFAIECPQLVISPVALPPATLDLPYPPVKFEASGGSGSYTFEIKGLPAGLFALPRDTIAGTPDEAGVFPVTVTVTDEDTDCTTTRIVPLTVECSAVSLVTPDLDNGTAGAEYADALAAAGGAEPYTFTQVSGALPPDLALFPAGTISGPATTAGAFTFEVTARDATGCTSDPRCYTIDVQPLSCPPGTDIALSPSLLSFALLGVPYSETFTAAGGTGPYTFSVTSGALPDGLTLDPATGTISGTPTSSGTFNFTVTATDVNGCLGSRCYVIGAGFSIPTLSQWTMFLLCAFLAGLAVAAVGRSSG
ncbi:MAG TPA: ice-binding family protein [Thermoanaerobaculia bacterium]|nr:ice-binding family protein [Thermoanaerobaculia bacterium]